MTVVTLIAGDGHALSAWQASPKNTAPIRGALVVLPEIFGVNAHIRQVCDLYAAQGWLAIAPSLFDRAQPGVELGYIAKDVEQARTLKAAIDEKDAMLDVKAAVDYAATHTTAVAVLGFCWGGTLAWLAAARLHNVRAAVAYYGTQIALHLNEVVEVPVMLHFGQDDPRIPPADVAAVESNYPRVRLHRYPAGHGFNCDARSAYHAPSSAQAGQRTLEFLKEVLPC